MAMLGMIVFVLLSMQLVQVDGFTLQQQQQQSVSSLLLSHSGASGSYSPVASWTTTTTTNLCMCSTGEDNVDTPGDTKNKKHRHISDDVDRRQVLKSVVIGLMSATTTNVILPSSSQRSWAGIDVSGLRVVEGGGGASANNALQQQLRAIDGSGSARVQQLQDLKSSSAPSSSSSSSSTQRPAQSTTTDDSISSAATYAYRYNPGVQPQLRKAGLAGERYRYQDTLALVSSSSTTTTPVTRGGGYLNVQFEFPSDWLQLDRVLGGIQYVDQRNGDKLIVLKSQLPDGESLITVPKQWFAQTVFDPKGTIVATTGIEVEDYRTVKSTTINDGLSTLTSPHRRLLLKYSTVTPNGLRTERRGLLDAYEINNVAYMMFTGSNAVKFDKNGVERETVERIVDSFVVEAVR
jgi:hypothetical protein